MYKNKFYKLKKLLGGLPNDYGTQKYLDDIELCKMIHSSVLNGSTTLLLILTLGMRAELELLYDIVKIYSELTGNPLNDCLRGFFCTGFQTGAIGDHDNRQEKIEELIADGNIREIIAAIIQFIKGEYIESTAIKGCRILWHLYLNVEEYVSKLKNCINIYNINHNKNKYKDIFGYDLQELLSENPNIFDQYGEFPNWCSTSVPILWNGTRHNFTNFENIEGAFPADLRPVIQINNYNDHEAIERNACLAHNYTKDEEVLIKLSSRELEYLKSTPEFEKLKTENPSVEENTLCQRLWRPGRCFFKDNNSFDRTFREKYNKHSLGNVSGHTLMFLHLLANFVPSKYLINGILSVKMSIHRFSIIILSLILWMVPIHHSINEILMAANTSYIHFYGGSMRTFEHTFTHSTISNIRQLIHNSFLPITDT